MTENTEKQNVPQQGMALPQEVLQQSSLLNARITNANLANADLIKEISTAFRTMAAIIVNLQEENAKLKQKAKNCDKP
ncbi:MAG: hypothetical protein NWF04_05370 [Candidatus Bathyarchaeota archaeon]|nr:hypothetical protein [Candidatus Bathyarchaeota archaeon]